MKNIEVLCQSEYQDIYRIKDGVLFIVNKFKYFVDDEGYKTWIYPDAKTKCYKKDCQKSLKILKEDYYCSRNELTVNKGTIIYHGFVTKLVPENEWEYQIKTTGEAFSGNIDEIQELSKEILKLVKVRTIV